MLLLFSICYRLSLVSKTILRASTASIIVINILPPLLSLDACLKYAVNRRVRGMRWSIVLSGSCVPFLRNLVLLFRDAVPVTRVDRDE